MDCSRGKEVVKRSRAESGGSERPIVHIPHAANEPPGSPGGLDNFANTTKKKPTAGAEDNQLKCLNGPGDSTPPSPIGSHVQPSRAPLLHTLHTYFLGL
ncbi:hypothetical protein N7453_000733 [Penicillium expansum]|nr:hypothetical protein N7453_000733 [Penicillium expansum]